MSFKLVCHPSVIAYDFRIAWTWKERWDRNRHNANISEIRIMFGMPTIAYGEYKEWQPHFSRRRLINFNP